MYWLGLPKCHSPSHPPWLPLLLSLLSSGNNDAGCVSSFRSNNFIYHHISTTLLLAPPDALFLGNAYATRDSCPSIVSLRIAATVPMQLTTQYVLVLMMKMTKTKAWEATQEAAPVCRCLRNLILQCRVVPCPNPLHVRNT